jgi:S-adenosylmethionine hydrolase
MSIITLTTDFGIVDEYSGVMKGVILSIHPDVTIIDITHHIHPQDIIHAAYTIKASYAYFPAGTVHIIVVDPGVGSDRPILAVEKSGHYFLAPDNGVLSLLFDTMDNCTIVHVKNDQYYLETVSHTFHGRDIFASVGAHLALGVRITDLGDMVEKEIIKRININEPIQTKDKIKGEIVSIDRFGNLISNIGCEYFEKNSSTGSGTPVEIQIGGKRIKRLSHSYEDSKDQEPLAIIGSRGRIEIALNKGSAQQYFNAKTGDDVIVYFLCGKNNLIK